jgi:Rrf2 family nitric oxide-sensitive transcriptional repressor
MRLTRYSDYSFRVLIHLALEPEQMFSISEIARAYGISQNHLVKVVHALSLNGLVKTVRGRSGGIRLARPAHEITVGEVFRCTEETMRLADCAACLLSPACGLTGVLAQGMAAMMKVFDSRTIADLVQQGPALRRQLARKPPSSRRQRAK